MSITGGGAGGSNMLDHRGSKSRASVKSSPKYGLDCWGDADKPFANITTENNATAKSIALTVSQCTYVDSLFMSLPKIKYILYILPIYL